MEGDAVEKASTNLPKLTREAPPKEGTVYTRLTISPRNKLPPKTFWSSQNQLYKFNEFHDFAFNPMQNTRSKSYEHLVH